MWERNLEPESSNVSLEKRRRRDERQERRGEWRNLQRI